MRRIIISEEQFNLIKPSVVEGISYDKESQTFSFDFVHDGQNDIIKLTEYGYKIDGFGKCFYYSYKFEDSIDSKTRTAFIHSLKFPDNHIESSDKRLFLRNAIGKLDQDISLPKYDILVYPQSRSELTRELMADISKIAEPTYCPIELIKELPKNIEFDYVRFKEDVLDSILENGRPRYTDTTKENVLNTINSLMDDIHKLDYFSIARDGKKKKYKQYIKNYYKFKSQEDYNLYESIQNSNILIIDDIVTTGITMLHLLKCLRTVNDNNLITVFSLIGKPISAIN